MARAIGIPSRLGYVDVTNHISTEAIRKRLRSSIFAFHSYTDLYMEGKWVKATPAFNSSLCEKLNVDPLEFNGIEDSLFQQFDRAGNRYMEYVFDHGVFPDLPYEKMISVFKFHYPHIAEEYNLKPNAKSEEKFQ